MTRAQGRLFQSVAGPRSARRPQAVTGLRSNVSANRFQLFKAIHLSSGLTRERWASARTVTNAITFLYVTFTALLFLDESASGCFRVFCSIFFCIFFYHAAYKFNMHALLSGQCHVSSGSDLKLIMQIAVDL